MHGGGVSRTQDTLQRWYSRQSRQWKAGEFVAAVTEVRWTSLNMAAEFPANVGITRSPSMNRYGPRPHATLTEREPNPTRGTAHLLRTGTAHLHGRDHLEG